ncbi:hypothetical protein QCA50_003545 [Cerrena zonata]|uniref:Uncharacterized protein n=1 Tax=Cerrena zonata TaxID=2478898 RepID=A0AAW0GWK4_9APHY
MPDNAPLPLANPYDAIAPPDFAGDFYEVVRTALIANQTAPDDVTAADFLLAKWTQHNEESKAEWNTQHPQPPNPDDDDPQQPPPPQPDPPQPEPMQPGLPPALEDNDSDEESAYPSIDKSEVLPSRIELIPLQSCITRLRDVKHVDLWYFTSEACADAAIVSRLDDRTLSFEKDHTSGVFTLKDAARGKKPIADSNLDWEQMTSAKALLLQYIIAEWPKKYVYPFMEFFFKIENHTLRFEKPEIGKRALIRYQAIARQQWHDTLLTAVATKKKKLWDIATIDEKLLDACVELVEQAEAKRLRIDLSAMQLQLNEGMRELRNLRDRPVRSFEPSRSEGKRARSPSFAEGIQFPPSKCALDSPRHFRDNAETEWVCILCLSLDPHNKVKCARYTLANGDKTWCHRDERGRIVNPQGNVICIEHNRRGCNSTDPKHYHECSGCGSTSHGAQSCHLVSKK